MSNLVFSYAKNIFISYTHRPHDFGNFTGQGFQTTLITSSLRVAFMLDTQMNLKIELVELKRSIWLNKSNIIKNS